MCCLSWVERCTRFALTTSSAPRLLLARWSGGVSPFCRRWQSESSLIFESALKSTEPTLAVSLLSVWFSVFKTLGEQLKSLRKHRLTNFWYWKGVLLKLELVLFNFIVNTLRLLSEVLMFKTNNFTLETSKIDVNFSTLKADSALRHSRAFVRQRDVVPERLDWVERSDYRIRSGDRCQGLAEDRLCSARSHRTGEGVREACHSWQRIHR